MTIDLSKLTSDLRTLQVEAASKVHLMKDGGSANRDAVCLNFKRKPLPKTYQKILTAIDEAGMSGHWCRSWGYRGFLISPCVPFQGGPNTIAAEHIHNGLKNLGWDVSMYYQLD